MRKLVRVGIRARGSIATPMRGRAAALAGDGLEGFLRLRSTRRTVADHIIRTRPVTDAGRRAAAEVAIRMLDDGEYPAADPQL
jgi:hypothetical protein